MGTTMGKNNIYVEQRPRGDYAVKRGGSSTPLATARTQARAIEQAKKLAPGVRVDVERVRDTKVGGRDKWRKA